MIMNTEHKVFTVSGHRPQKLFGFDLKDPRYFQIRKTIQNILKNNQAQELWTGMALGTDMLAALAAFDMMDENYDIQVNAAIPFQGHNNPKWPEASRMLYDAILYKIGQTGGKIHTVSDTGYSAVALELRNQYMVDQSDALIAVYSGASGGTANCIKYARKKNMPIWIIDPKDPDHASFIPPANQKGR